ncbi:DNA polymerase alpha catalytic subunit (Fragment) [Seminavis robusta]|uniref:DNA polymerase n=1 Tax=Seminavis robusta TaxID=568900 RepID=A0A9N8H1U8_9STRA
MSSASRRQKKSAALASLRQRRQQGFDLDDVEIKDEEDIYEVVDEEEYGKLVNARRQREDFIVDDDGLGYYDDGEEHLGGEPDEGGNTNRKRANNGNATLTKTALKKAKRNKTLLDQAGMEQDKSQPSMWNFVTQGTATGPAFGGGSNNNKNKKSSSSRYGGASATTNVDDLLKQLDNAPLSTSRRRSSSAPRRRSRGRQSNSGRRRSESQPRRSREVDRQKADAHDHEEDDDDNMGMMPFDDGNDDDHYDDDDVGKDQDMAPDEEKPDEEKTNTEGTRVRFAPDANDGGNDGDVEMATDETKDGNKDDINRAAVDTNHDASDDKDKEEDEEEAPRPRKRLARRKLGQDMSAPAKKAMEEKEIANQKKQPEPTPEEQSKKSAVTMAAMTATFKPDEMAAAGSSNAATTAASSAELGAFLQTKETESGDAEQYIDFFWIDIADRGNGEILLFGKVAVPPEPKSKNSKPQFVSCCALIKNNLRNLFVLPRVNEETGEYAPLQKVHQEINSVLKGPIIPKVEGAWWRGKPVTRKYAFDDCSIPRDETEYLKVVYDAKFPSPSQEICEKGGEHFQKILGGGASVLETFIVKRELLGPCWIRIKQPVATRAPVSWCKLELQVNDPKNIKRLDLLEPGNRPPPPVVAVSIKLKTVVNPKTQKSEIVTVSAVCHKEVLLDTASDESVRHMSQITIIRPLARGDLGGAVPKFPRDFEREASRNMPDLCREYNERALLCRLLAQLGQWDPDVLVGHNIWGFDAEVLLNRCRELKVSLWSKLGRRRRMQMPSKSSHSGRKDYAIADAMSGRLLCDTYLSAKELLRETTYSLTNLAATQLKTQRVEVEPVDIPQWYESSKTIVRLAQHTLFDTQLVHRLMFKLQILPLTKQLTCIAGNLWSHTMKSNRAERTEYLLLHEFHRLKHLVPEKRRPGSKKGAAGKGKAKYSGGLVLEPKKGLYDSFILLLDFNSLYPSLIQEYNLCFTTIEWATFATPVEAAEGEEEEVSKNLPPLPDESKGQGVLPRVIKNLVERRRNVKKMLKSEKNADKAKELDIRQQALKLTANSMYGCLGFSNSRFYAQPIAAMVTMMGRETLQRTVTIAQDSVGLDVIYGDTDSIMINTRLSNEADLPKVKELGERVKREVNRLYRTLELEIDGVFRSMLLLKKKKYAAKTVVEGPDGITYGQELKGLDLVRRDWCIQSKDTGRFLADQILSGEDPEIVVNNIHNHLEELAKKMRNNELPLEKYTITKGLSKHPNDYPDGKSQAHVHVAKMMLKDNRPVNTGDHIPYIITAPIGTPNKDEKVPTPAERARHPDEILRSGGVLKPDVEYYLAQQILPPVARLCEPIQQTSQRVLASKMGLDSAKYSQSAAFGDEEFDNDDVDYTPESCKPDRERFQNVEKFKFRCSACKVESEFPGVFHVAKNPDGTVLVEGLRCVNPECSSPNFWGCNNHFQCFARLGNAMTLWVHNLHKKYYEGVIRCDEPMCSLETRQLSVHGGICLRRGCNGRMKSVCTERAVHTQLKYLETLFDIEHACEQKKTFGKARDLQKNLSREGKVVFEELHKRSQQYLSVSAFNWVSPSFWQSMIAGGAQSSALQ